MKAVDFSVETLESLKPRLAGLRQRVWEAWARFGPGTTREVAAKSGIGLLTFRPRTTELMQIGLVCLEENGTWKMEDGKEGVYRARTMEEWTRHVEVMAGFAREKQMKLI